MNARKARSMLVALTIGGLAVGGSAAQAAGDAAKIRKLAPYALEDWPRGLREEARNAYVTVAYALAGVATERGDHDAATRYLYRVLARDPHDERAHLALIGALEDVGRRGDARRRTARTRSTWTRSGSSRRSSRTRRPGASARSDAVPTKAGAGWFRGSGLRAARTSTND